MDPRFAAYVERLLDEAEAALKANAFPVADALRLRASGLLAAYADQFGLAS